MFNIFVMTNCNLLFFREESFFVLGCVLAISLLLSGMEVVWDMQVQMDQFYYVIFWLQSFFIVLPFGMIGRHFLEFQSFQPILVRELLLEVSSLYQHNQNMNIYPKSQIYRALIGMFSMQYNFHMLGGLSIYDRPLFLYFQNKI